MTEKYCFGGIIEKFSVSRDGNVLMKISGIDSFSVRFYNESYNLFWLTNLYKNKNKGNKNLNSKSIAFTEVAITSKGNMLKFGKYDQDSNSKYMFDFLKEMAIYRRPVKLIISNINNDSIIIDSVSNYDYEE